MFVPWATTGLDATTRHRLRVPVGDLRSILRASATGALWSGDAVREFGAYFSRREASMLENLLVFPLTNGDDVQAVLLITETPYFEEHSEYLRIILAAVSEPAAHSIHSARVAFTATMSQSIVFKTREIDVVARQIASRDPNAVYVVLLQLSDVVSQVSTANEHLDRYRVWQDVLRAVAALFATTASVCDADDQRALLLIHGSVDEDLSLIVQHVSATLATLLPEISAAPVLRFDSRVFPDDGDLVELAHELS